MGEQTDDRSRLFEPVSVPTAAEVVVDRLTRAIELARLLPGDRLPAERELALQLGVSRVTLRAALGRLEESGTLERSARGSGGGSLVVATTPVVRDRGEHSRTREDLREIFEFRLACESTAAELAASRRTDADIAAMARAIDELSGAQTLTSFRASDNAFHLALADAARNRRLRAAVEDARAAMFHPLDLLRFALAVPRTVEDHRRILAAVVAGDPASAREAVLEHLAEARDELLIAYAIGDPPP